MLIDVHGREVGVPVPWNPFVQNIVQHAVVLPTTLELGDWERFTHRTACALQNRFPQSNRVLGFLIIARNNV